MSASSPVQTVIAQTNGWSLFLALALITLLCVIGAYDVLTSYGVLTGRTVSSVLHGWSIQFPILPFLIGLLIGHLLWPVWTK